VHPVYSKTKMVVMATSLSCRVSGLSAFRWPTTQTPSITNCLVAIVRTKSVISVLVPKLVAMATTLRHSISTMFSSDSLTAKTHPINNKDCHVIKYGKHPKRTLCVRRAFFEYDIFRTLHLYFACKHYSRYLIMTIKTPRPNSGVPGCVFQRADHTYSWTHTQKAPTCSLAL